ncbi:NACHT domain-containing protein [Phormidesmis priestleyi]
MTEVEREVISRLSQSLHNAVLINLDKQIQPQQVRNPLSAEIKIGALPSRPLPPGTEILEVFERSDISGRLLILGDPGAGKTTTLLDLAKGLVERAIADSANPIPVIFALSAWKDPKQEMKDWLIAELKSKYGVRIDIGKKWIENKQLLPLLDGLDEVKPEHQESCVNAINQLLGSDDRPSDLVVCSRREEYETYQTQLQLNGAICLKDLTNEQIQDYSKRVNQPELWQMLQLDAALLELVRKPLFLSITILAYGEIALEQWQKATSTQARLALLLDAYVIRMLHTNLKSRSYGKCKPPTAKQTRRWLVCLACQLKKETETEFLIEKMQPFLWLQSDEQQWAYSLICGLVFGLVFGLILGLTGGPILGLAFGLFFGLTSGLGDIRPVEGFQISMTHKAGREIFIFKGGSYRLVFGLIGRLIFGLIGRLIFGLIFGLIVALINGLVFGLVFGLFSGLIDGLKVDIEARIRPNQGILNSRNNTLLLVVISLVLVALIQAFLPQLLVQILDKKSVSTIPASAMFCLVCISFQEGGGQACIQHFALRFVLYYNNLIPWNYARFLNYATERMFLQRVGGRYRFIHKLLQEHFADMRDEE